LELNSGTDCIQLRRFEIKGFCLQGFGDTIRLLLVLDARLEQADKEGCTALHWAAIRGNGEACTILMQVSMPYVAYLQKLSRRDCSVLVSYFTEGFLQSTRSYAV